MNKLLKVACMLAASTVFAANAQDLRLGVEPGYAPFEVKTPEGKLAGFDIDLGNELANVLLLIALGWKANLTV